MYEVVGFHRACELVRRHVPYEIAVGALMADRQLGRPDAVAAVLAAIRWVEDDADLLVGASRRG